MTKQSDMARGTAIAFGVDQRAAEGHWNTLMIVGYLSSLLADLTSDNPHMREDAKRLVLEYERRGQEIIQRSPE